MLSELARSHERITELEHRLDLLQRNLGVATEFLAATQPGYAQLLGLERPPGPRHPILITPAQHMTF